MHDDKDVAATFLLFITSKMCCSLAVTMSFSLSYTYSTGSPLLFIPCLQLPLSRLTTSQ